MRHILVEKTSELSDDLAAWREQRRVGQPMPEELWTRAVQLAQEQGLYKTARALPLDYGALKKRVADAGGAVLAPRSQRLEAASNLNAETLFVELLAPASNRIAECKMRVVATNGATLEVEVKDIDAHGLRAILKEFGG